jgi:hypothetical protein
MSVLILTALSGRGVSKIVTTGYTPWQSYNVESKE